jgi:HEXXH motif-containing protein
MSGVWDGATHRLGNYELTALARGKLTARIAGKLVAAESSKHRLLIEAVRRRVADIGPSVDRDILEAAIRMLTEIEVHSPYTVAKFLELPQIGSWAASCLRRMANGWDSGEASEGQAPLGADLGYLSAVAAAAALRSGHPAELQVPLRAASLLPLPSLGMASLGSADPWGIAHLWIADNVVRATSSNRTVVLPMGGEVDASPVGARWQPVPRLHTEADGILLDVALDALDPFLSGLGEPTPTPSAKKLAAWQHRLTGAWQILVHYHRETAKAFALVVSTLVPLADASIADSRSATSGWTFGAIGLSLPRTPVSFAEILVHEFQHIILGALEDLEPLVTNGSDEPLGYAPWRDDPRPIEGVLHGCYAYLGLTAFWRQQRRFGKPTDRIRSEVDFARWRLAALETARRVEASPDLTQTGRLVVKSISEQLCRWRDEPVTTDAERLASEARAEHRTRWRINNMRPLENTVTEIARAWLAGPLMLQYRADMDSLPKTEGAVIGPILGYLMEMRYRDPKRFVLLMQGGINEDPLGNFITAIDEGDIALLYRDNTTAVHEYTRRLHKTSDIGAWIGLAAALQHTGPPASAWVLAERPELVAALHLRIRAISAHSPEPLELTEWLARCLMPSSTPARPI